MIVLSQVELAKRQYLGADLSDPLLGCQRGHGYLLLLFILVKDDMHVLS